MVLSAESEFGDEWIWYNFMFWSKEKSVAGCSYFTRIPIYIYIDIFLDDRPKMGEDMRGKD